jgi:3-hydroxyphenylacetate 6-hydroxylase
MGVQHGFVLLPSPSPSHPLTLPLPDPEIWSDPLTFRPARWLSHPDAPLFTYGLGYRMCAGSLLANRELYLVFLRMLGSFEIIKDSEVDVHPVTGSADPTSLVTRCRDYRVVFRPRDEGVLRGALEAWGRK